MTSVDSQSDAKRTYLTLLFFFFKSLTPVREIRKNEGNVTKMKRMIKWTNTSFVGHLWYNKED